MDDHQDQSSNQSGGDISFLGAFGTAFRALRDNIEIAALLSGLLAVMWMILVGSIIADVFLLALQNPGTRITQPLPEGVGFGFFLLIIVFFYISQLPLVIWARVSTLGRSDAMDGGIPALLSRALWCFWRFVCVYGWMLLLFLGSALVILVLAALAGAIGAISFGFEDIPSGFGTVGMMIGWVLDLGLMYIVSSLMGLYFVTIHAESRDTHLNIRESSKTLGPRTWKLGGVIFIGQLALMIVLVVVMGAIGLMFANAGGSTTAAIVIMGLLMFAGAIMNFFFLNLAAVYADLLSD